MCKGMASQICSMTKTERAPNYVIVNTTTVAEQQPVLHLKS